MLVCGIYEILCHDTCSHLQTCDVAIELASHVGARKAARSPQLTRYQTAIFSQRQQDRLLYRALHRLGELASTPVAQVWPPLTADEPRLARKELAIDATALLHNTCHRRNRPPAQ